MVELYGYDVFNRLVNVKNDEGTSIYTYKPDGLRAGTTKKGVMGSTGSEDVTTTYIWDGSNIVLEYGASNAVYLRGINLIAADKNGAKNYYLYNAHGDVIQMVNASGTLIKSYQYDSFGVEIDPDPNDTNVWRYAGEMFDKETGNYYLRARYYNPSNGRFLTEDTHWNPNNMIYGDNPQKINERQDPLGLTIYTYQPNLAAIRQSGNLYVYCTNNPIAYIDPSGNIIIELVFAGMIIGAVVGAGMEIYSQLSNGKTWSTLDKTDILVATVSGGASGALGATGYGFPAQIAGNGVIAALTSAAKDLLNGKAVDVKTMTTEGIGGMVAGLIGGRGLQFGKIGVKNTIQLIGKYGYFTITEYMWPSVLRSLQKELVKDATKGVITEKVFVDTFKKIYEKLTK